VTAAVTSSSTRSGPAPTVPPSPDSARDRGAVPRPAGDRQLDLSELDPTCTVRLRRIGRLNGPVRIVEATSLVGESTEMTRHAAQAWLVKKQADR
jgi:hypothetical protein